MKLKDKIIAKLPEEKRPQIIKTLNVLRIIKNTVCWTLIIILTFLMIGFMLSRVSGNTPSLFGYTVQRISSGSMEPEFLVGDVILSKEIDDVASLKVGDIITFKGGDQFGNNNVTHRVVVAPKEENGTMMLQTKGDANEVYDEPIRADQVQSKYICKISFLTKLYAFFLSPWGLLVFIALLILIFFDEILNIIHITSRRENNDGNNESITEIIDRIQREDAEKNQNNKNVTDEKSNE